MAAPPEMTTRDISGTFVMNNMLSDSTDPVLALQGLSWFTRKAIGLATVTLAIKHYKDDAGIERIDIDQTLTGGIKGNTENRIMDWTERNREDPMFGAVVAKSRRITLEQMEGDFLRSGWSPDAIEHGFVQAFAQSDTPKSGKDWVVNQVWGFKSVNGERRFARHLEASSISGKPENKVQITLVYDYLNA